MLKESRLPTDKTYGSAPIALLSAVEFNVLCSSSSIRKTKLSGAENECGGNLPLSVYWAEAFRS